jgi:hypothetical protein
MRPALVPCQSEQEKSCSRFRSCHNCSDLGLAITRWREFAEDCLTPNGADAPTVSAMMSPRRAAHLAR